MKKVLAGGWGVMLSATVLALGMTACNPGSGGSPGGPGTGAGGDGSTTGGAGAGGSTGTTGSTGSTGATDPTGSTGSTGAPGSTGTSGGAGTTEPAEESFEGTAGATDKVKERMKPGVLAGVRAGRHSSFDRMTFEFQGQDVPGYHIEYIDHPVRQCASGEEVAIAGQGWLLVRIKPAQAHTEAGQSSIPSRSLKPGLDVLKEAALTCDYEGDVSWVLGVSSPNKYRVIELTSPPRLVVDVKH